MPNPSTVKRDELDIEELFTYHAPRPGDASALRAIRNKAKELAETVVICCPPSADRTAAIRKLRECVMTANASIALEPDPFD
jgi:hypothetical protein